MFNISLEEYRIRTLGVKDKNLYRVVLQKLMADLDSDETIVRYDNFIFLTGLLREDEIDLSKYDLSTLLTGLGILVGGKE